MLGTQAAWGRAELSFRCRHGRLLDLRKNATCSCLRHAAHWQARRKILVEDDGSVVGREALAYVSEVVDVVWAGSEVWPMMRGFCGKVPAALAVPRSRASAHGISSGSMWWEVSAHGD